MTDTFSPGPAVLAEDLRALADTVPFDEETRELLEQSADHLDDLANMLTARKAPSW